MTLCAPAARAAEFSIDPSATLGARYDTNPRFLNSHNDIESAWGTELDLKIPLQYRTPRASVSVEPRLDYRFYPKSDEDDLEDRDKYLTGVGDWRSLTTSMGAAYGYTDLNLRTSEFQDAGSGSDGGSGGQVFSNKDRQKRLFIRPYWRWQWTARNAFDINANFEKVRYVEKFSPRRYDYQYGSVSAGVTRTLTSRQSLALRGTASRFDSENDNLAVSNDSRTNSVSLIYSYSLSELTTLSADIGWARTKNTVSRPNAFDPVAGLVCSPALIPFFPCEFKSDSDNFVGNISASRSGQTTQYKVTLGQSITPNSNGAQVLRFNLDATANQEFTERFGARVGLLAFTQQDVGDSDRNYERDYVRGSVRLRYRVLRDWAVVGTYNVLWNQESYLLSTEQTTRNQYVIIGVEYNGNGWRW